MAEEARGKELKAAPSLDSISSEKTKTLSLETFDILVEKLDKLDKLDELLKKLNNMNNMMPSSSDDSAGRSYTELKVEMEALQKIIFDDTVHDKEKEDANIKFEKVFGELQNTEEYRRELAQIAEEKRRINEPLNKDALEKMMKILTPENLRTNEELKDRLMQNPELLLIGLDPKSIIAKHQNDFAGYFMRGLTLVELRAIRASLPKFRKDQKRQLEWVETLENRIEAVSKDPPKAAKKAAPKPPASLTKKKVAQQAKLKAGAPPGDLFAELKKKRLQME